MDLDDARRRIHESTDPMTIAVVLLEVLELLGKMDIALSGVDHRVTCMDGDLQAIRREANRIASSVRAGLRP